VEQKRILINQNGMIPFCLCSAIFDLKTYSYKPSVFSIGLLYEIEHLKCFGVK